MKRHPLLQQLSREHHHGLVLARRATRWAGQPELEAAAWTTVRDTYATQLRPHFDEEEQRVLPMLPAEHQALVARTLADHRRLRELAVHGSTRDELAELGSLLTEHIRFEERELFPEVERGLAGDPDRG